MNIFCFGLFPTLNSVVRSNCLSSCDFGGISMSLSLITEWILWRCLNSKGFECKGAYGNTFGK